MDSSSDIIPPIEILGAAITQGTASDGTEVTQTIFNTTDPDSDIQITENLVETVMYDYSELFAAASKIANESRQTQLEIDIDGFNEFKQAAYDLSNLLNGFIIKLQNVSVINDTVFLTSIATSTVQMPKSSHTTAVILRGVMSEINCAMNYINNFVNSVDPKLEGTALSAEEQNIISTAVQTIDSWNMLCEHGVTISLQNNTDVQYITQASSELNNTTIVLQTATAELREKIAQYVK